nr:hypothetical protein [Tanacetum cinerariifolium]
MLFPVWSFGSTNPQNTDGDVAFNEKEPEFKGRKPESEVNVSPRSKFEDSSDNRINKDNAPGTLVPTIGQLSPNNTNTFSVAGPSNAAASPTHGKSSYVDSFQLLDDSNMLKLEDITYSDDVGAEADFNNLETSITNSPIPTTRLHKDHHINNDDFYTCMFACFLSQEEPKRVHQALKDLSWIEAMQEELLQFKMQKVWILVDLPHGKRAIDLCKAFEKLMKDKFQMSSMGELTFFLGLQVKQKKDGIFISEDKYVAEILRKFRLTDGKSASTPKDTEKPLLKDPDGEDVDAHTYRSMIGSLMYLTSSRPDIMFAVFVCARFQVTPKASHLHAVNRIFRYLKGKPHLGLWYPRDSPFDLMAYSDSDYAGATLDTKSTTGGVNTPRSDEDRLELLELTVFLLPSDKKVGIKTSVAVKKVNDVTRLQALVNKKKVIITEAMIRDALCLDDAEGIKCLPNEEIFTELARMGYEKPSTKLTFYKAFFSRCDLSSHTTKYSFPALTQKVFANMRRVRKGCSGVKTPLFEGMIVEQQVDEGAAEVHVEDVSSAGVAAKGDVSAADDVVPTTVERTIYSIPYTTYFTTTTITRSTFNISKNDKIAQALEITKLKQRVKKLERRNKASKLQRLKKVGTAQRIETSDDTVMDDVSKQERMIANMDADVDVILEDSKEVDVEKSANVLSIQDDNIEPAELPEVVEVVTTVKLITEVVTATSATITAAAPQLTTAAAPTLTTAPSATRRRTGVVIRDLKESATPSTIIHSEAKSKDKGKWILVEEPKPLKKQAKIKQDETYARELEAKLNKNIDWDKVIDHVQRKKKEDNAVKRYQALKRKPRTEAQARKNMMIYLRNVAGFKMDYFKEQIDEEDSRALKRLSGSQDDKTTKKHKLDKEVEELKRHLQIVPNNEDDVYTEDTPLARKVPVVKYEIYNENNKPYYKIKRADGSHQRYLKRRYPLTMFTLDQMLNNVRLEVEEESEVLGTAEFPYKLLVNQGFLLVVLDLIQGDPPVPDLRTMEELYQPTLIDRGGPIAPIAIQATKFRLKNDMIQQVQNSCKFHGLPGDDANKHLDKFLHVTHSIKVNGVTDDALRLYLFPHSLTHHSTIWFDRFPRNCTTTFEKMAKIFLGKYFPPSMVTKPRNDITNFRQRIDESHRDTIKAAAGGTFMKRRLEECYDLIKNMTAHHNDWDTSVQRTTVGQTQNVYDAGAYNQGGNSYQPQGSGTLLGNTITNPKEDLMGITTRSGNAYKGPTVPTTSSPPKVVECETEVTKDTVPPTNNRSTKDVQPPVVQVKNPIPNSKPIVAPIVEPVKAAVSAPNPNPKPSIPYPPTIKSLLTNNDKLFKLARTLLNENFSVVLLKKLTKKFRDLGKFLIPCDFLGMDECLALADLGASINLMPLSVWNKLSLHELSPTCMALEPADQTVTFNLDQTARYSANYDAMLVNRIDLIDIACEEYSHEVLGFFMSINPTPSTEPIVSNSSPTLTPFGEKFLNDDPSSPPLPPQELKVVEPTIEKYSIDEPLMVELKDLPPHLEYAFLEGDAKLLVIIDKELKDEEKTALIKVLKSHKQDLSWQLSDIKGIDLEFCTHKILMEDDFKPVVQHQRRVNPKIHDVIKKE